MHNMNSPLHIQHQQQLEQLVSSAPSPGAHLASGTSVHILGPTAPDS